MRKRFKLNRSFTERSEELNELVLNFENQGTPFGEYQDRNRMKIFEFGDQIVNIKFFKIPHLLNQIVYRFIRKSKAQRSFEYAQILLEKGVRTPYPIGYFEFTTILTFKESYYLSEQVKSDLTYRDLTLDLNYPDFENILRQFTRFTYYLHEQNINFLDHSPGNTLIKRTTAGYEFFLVDLNRMKFGPLTFEERIKNFAKLTIHKSMIEVMSDEYAKCVQRDYNEVFDLMWASTLEFQERFHRRKRIKKKLKFWKKH
jgi:hypothetical protein